VRKLSVDDVLHVLEGLYELKKARPQLHARLKHLHRLDFPAGHVTGQGFRSSYDIDKLIQIGLAFALIDVGMTPSEATGIISANWPVIEHEVSSAMGGAECSLIVEVRALSEMGAVLGSKKTRKRTAILVSEGAPPINPKPMASVVLDLARFMRKLEHHVLQRPDLDAYDFRLAVAQACRPSDGRPH
jgi:hypothetical protein